MMKSGQIAVATLWSWLEQHMKSLHRVSAPDGSDWSGLGDSTAAVEKLSTLNSGRSRTPISSTVSTTSPAVEHDFPRVEVLETALAKALGLPIELVPRGGFDGRWDVQVRGIVRRRVA